MKIKTILLVSLYLSVCITATHAMKPFSCTRANYEKVQIGWTKAQVKAVFGDPKAEDQIDSGDLGKVERWFYWPVTRSKSMIIIFDANGRVTDKGWERNG